MKKTACLIALCIAVRASAMASDLKISDEMLFVEGPRDNRVMYAILNLEWKNTWRNDLNHDAVWLFAKLVQGENGYLHVPLQSTGHEVLFIARGSASDVALRVAQDGTGLFIQPAKNYRGDISLKLKLAIDPTSFARMNMERVAFRAFGIEMVHIPTGAFYAGETDSAAAYQYSAFYQKDGQGRFNGPVFIASENELTVGKYLDYRPKQTVYLGDARGVIPAAFPKGYAGFYVMKYEIRQGEYAAFLNTLSNGQTQQRNNFGGRDYYTHRSTIAFDGEKYVAGSPGRPCNFLSFLPRKAGKIRNGEPA